MNTIYFTLLHCTLFESQSIPKKLTPRYTIRIIVPYYIFFFSYYLVVLVLLSNIKEHQQIWYLLSRNEVQKEIHAAERTN